MMLMHVSGAPVAVVCRHRPKRVILPSLQSRVAYPQATPIEKKSGGV